MTSAKEKIVNILLIEDNDADSRLFQILFSKQKSQSVFHVITDGEEAAIFFEEGNEGHFEPDLIVLDLNIPKIDGKEILKRIRATDRYRCIPAIVLTSSESLEDIRQSYEAGANCVLMKPVDIESATHLYGLIEEFWVNTVKLMPRA